MSAVNQMTPSQFVAWQAFADATPSPDDWSQGVLLWDGFATRYKKLTPLAGFIEDLRGKKGDATHWARYDLPIPPAHLLQAMADEDAARRYGRLHTPGFIYPDQLAAFIAGAKYAREAKK